MNRSRSNKGKKKNQDDYIHRMSHDLLKMRCPRCPRIQFHSEEKHIEDAWGDLLWWNEIGHERYRLGPF